MTRNVTGILSSLIFMSVSIVATIGISEALAESSAMSVSRVCASFPFVQAADQNNF
jgi:hypothetical protein